MSPVLGIIASSNQQGRAGGPVGAYDALASIKLSSAASSVTFSSIPAGYEHLQIRMLARTARAIGGTNLIYTFNGDTGASYPWHYVTGDGSSAYSGGSTAATNPYILKCTSANSSTNIFGVGVWDILDYASTTKFKTSRAISGYDNNTAGEVVQFSSSWQNLAPVTSIRIADVLGDNFAVNTWFALYGVK